MKKTDPEGRNQLKMFGLLGAVTFDLVGSTLGGLGLGYLSNRFLGWPKFFMGIMAGVGFLWGIYQLYRTAKAQMSS